ncbi:MAG: hypothetical protein IPI00_18675 [Flavobacteriales bacterium]|nr:hypothetical protein [Flavobacteriales bacterium]
MKYGDWPLFDVQAFNAFKEVEVSVYLKEAPLCDPPLEKEKSLFITDLSVVEDVDRTYNVATNNGDHLGAWTFGTLMANMENGMHADGLRGFLNDWIKQWITDQSVNGYTVKARNFALDKMIEPWIRKVDPISFLTITPSTWEAIWDALPEEDIRKFAPFKLTAIVNRLDLRGNAGYTAEMSNMGETRFIFTLIDPVTGSIPISPNQTESLENNGVGRFDWRGMNVIFEYGNPQTTRCQLKDFARAWLNLSDPGFSFGNAAADNPYKNALQAITDVVTLPNVAPNKINGSAINRLRTNEKAFATFVLGQTAEEAWEEQDWEFRQFELESVSHSLSLVPLTNNPDHTANDAPNIQEDFYSNQQVNNSDLINWVFNGHRFQVLNGNFNMPTTLLSGSGIVRREEAQYIDLDRNAVAATGGYDALQPSEQAKLIRHQLSVNTCAGCHAGETKTVFTHVNALAFGEGARYWLPTLDGASDIPQDPHFYPWNSGGPLLSNGRNNGQTLGAGYNFTVSQDVRDRNFFQSVSPFLIGRRYVLNLGQTTGTWDDDLNSDTGDDNMSGLFYVYDPSNDGDFEFPFISDRRSGFNDLERRKNLLCQFLSQTCTNEPPDPLTVSKRIDLIQFTPLPLAAH